MRLRVEAGFSGGQTQQRADDRVKIARRQVCRVRVTCFSKSVRGERHTLAPALLGVTLQDLAEIWESRVTRAIFGTVFLSNVAATGWIRVQTGRAAQLKLRMERAIAADAVTEAVLGRLPAHALLQEAGESVLPLHV